MLWGEVSDGPRGEGEGGDLGGLSLGKGQAVSRPRQHQLSLHVGRQMDVDLVVKNGGLHLLGQQSPIAWLQW